MVRKGALAALAAAAGLLLSSCVGIESHVTFARDGSGVLKIEYRVAKSLADLGRGAGSSLPLPVNEQELRQALTGVRGLRLMGLSRREDEKDILIAAEIGFDRIESVAAVEAFADMPMRLERSGDDFVFHQLIWQAEPGQTAAPAAGAQGAQGAQAAGSESDKELAVLFAGLFEGYELVFVVSAPRPIKSHNVGDVSPDRKSVTWRLPLERMAELPQETALTVTW